MALRCASRLVHEKACTPVGEPHLCACSACGACTLSHAHSPRHALSARHVYTLQRRIATLKGVRFASLVFHTLVFHRMIVQTPLVQTPSLIRKFSWALHIIKDLNIWAGGP